MNVRASSHHVRRIEGSPFPGRLGDAGGGVGVGFDGAAVTLGSKDGGSAPTVPSARDVGGA
jgi:hypothetical protein